MLKNYLVTSLRSLRRNPGFSFINVSGLAVGLACCILIVLFVRDELSYDRYHENAEQIARLVRDQSAMTAGPMAPALAAEISGVSHATRLDFENDLILSSENEQQFTERVFFADSSFFEIFKFQFVQGDPATALLRQDGLVLSESAAQRMFGDDDPMGQTLTATVFGGPTSMTVTGIVEDTPRRSHFHFDVMASFQIIDSRSQRMDNWGTNWLYTYLLMTENTSAAGVQAQLPAFFETHTAEAWDHFRIQPLLDIHLRSNFRFEIEPQGSITFVYIFSAIALLVLLIACINFMNLTTARSGRRAREVGMRKVLGARRGQLINQFVGEAVILALMATAVAWLLAAALLPLFSQMAQKEFSLAVLINWKFIAALFGSALLLGLVSGGYPAFILSAFQPISTLKGKTGKGGGHAWLRKGLVVFQFAVSCILIVGTLVILQQLQFVQDKDLSFEKEQIVVLKVDGNSMAGNYELLKSELMQSPNIVSVSASNDVPGRAVSDFLYRPEGLEEDDDDLPGWNTYFVDPEFVETLQLEIVDGRALDSDRAGDENGYLINESLVASMQERLGEAWDTLIGKQLDFYIPGQSGWEVIKTGPIVGLVKDFHYRSLREEITPLVLQSAPFNFGRIFVKISTADVTSTLSFIEETHGAFVPDAPFDFFFLDSFFDSLYESEVRAGRLIGIFAVIAIAIAGLGLFGLATFMTELRIKEIGVRKVVGASVPGIVALLTKEFATLVLLGTVLAVPVAYIGISRCWRLFPTASQLARPSSFWPPHSPCSLQSQR